MVEADNDFLRPNQRLQVEVLTGSLAGKYVSRVEDVETDKVAISLPTASGQGVPLRPGTSMKLTVMTESALYQFETSVLERKQLGAVPVLVVSKPDSMKKVQRRSFFRVSAVLSAQYRFLSSVDSYSTEPFKTAATKDISGGGTCLVLLEDVKKEQLFELKIELPKMGFVNAVARAVMVKGDSGKKKDVALEFAIIDESEREKVVKYVFQRQAELRRKERRWE